MKKRRYAKPCPKCTYHGRVEVRDVAADVFCCIEHGDATDDDFGVIILKWGEGQDYSQHCTLDLACGLPDEAGRLLLAIGELDDVPLRALWAKALLLVVRDARAYRMRRRAPIVSAGKFPARSPEES